MNYPALAKAQNLIRLGDISGAESALATLADEEGDQALVLALEIFPPKDLLTVIREYDSSKESVLNLLVTPQQFARAVVIEKQYKDLNHTHLRGMVNSVIFRDEADPAEFLEAIGAADGGCEALADYLMEHWSRVESFVHTGTFDPMEDDGTIVPEAALIAAAYAKPRVERDEARDSDWMELTWLLHHAHPDLFIEVMTILRTRFKAFQAAQDSGAEDEDGETYEKPEVEKEFHKTQVVDPDEESAI